MSDELLKNALTWGLRLSLVFGVLTAITAFLAGFAGAELSKHSDAALAKAGQDASHANEHASQLDLKSETLRHSNLALQERVEHLRADNTKLTNQLLPRTLTKEQVDGIAADYSDALRTGVAGAVYVEQSNITEEALSYSMQIGRAFAGQDHVVTFGGSRGIRVSGVFVILLDPKRTAVLDILKRHGIDAKPMQDYSHPPLAMHGADWIVVGEKPGLTAPLEGSGHS